MKNIVLLLCAFAFFINSSCCRNCDDDSTPIADGGEETIAENKEEVESDENDTNSSPTLTQEEYIERVKVSLSNNLNLEVRDLSSFETDSDLIAFPDRDVEINENGVLSLGLGYVNSESQVNGIGFSIGDDQRAYVIFPTLQVGEPLNTISIDLELGLDNCEFIRDLCDIIPIRFFAIKSDGTVSVSFTDHMKFGCTECPLTAKNTAWANLFTDSVTNTEEEYFSNHEQLRSFVITSQDEFVNSQHIDYPNWGEPGYMPPPGEQILSMNQFNTVQCYEQGSFHVIRVKKDNLMILFYAPVSVLEHYELGVNSESENFWLTGAGTSVGSLIEGPTVMVYELDKPPGANWWILNSEYPGEWKGEYIWKSSEDDLLYPRPFLLPFRAKHHLRLFTSSLDEHRPFLAPRTYESISFNRDVEYIRGGRLFLNVYLTCHHMKN
ncbi:hypothetical protein [Maribacter sp. 2308TA10-17]|uniref:hypothetical protein n=1 Tax=Maribacter sp. 2308TA10-17 TaxID=3386276 RepID=UPI0039BD00D5